MIPGMRKKPQWMNGLIPALLVFGAIILTGIRMTGVATAENDSLMSLCNGATEETIRKHIPVSRLEVMSMRPMEGACEVIADVDGDYLPFYIFQGFVIAGDMFRDRKHVTEDGIRSVYERRMSVLAKELETLTAFTYKPSRASEGRIIYMLTDPDCAYCEEAKKEAKDLADGMGIELRVVFYPLPRHPEAKKKAEAAICSKIGYAEYLEGRYGQGSCEEGVKKTEKMLSLAARYGLTGTPMFINPSGKYLVGFDKEDLKRLI